MTTRYENNKKTYNRFQLERRRFTVREADKTLDGLTETWEAYNDKGYYLNYVLIYPANCFTFEVLDADGNPLFIMPGYTEVISEDFEEVERAVFNFFIEEGYEWGEE